MQGFKPSFLLGLFLSLFASTFLGSYLFFSGEPEVKRILVTNMVPESVTTVTATATLPSLDGREIFKAVEQMPLFPGPDCGDIRKYKKRKPCAERSMLKYIYKNVKYPKRARERGVQGLAVVSFVVEPHGAITNIEVVRDPGAGLGRAAEKVVQKMRDDNLRWEPGLKKGKPVRVQFNLPVKFKLE